jgi:hypothetical protein
MPTPCDANPCVQRHCGSVFFLIFVSERTHIRYYHHPTCLGTPARLSPPCPETRHAGQGIAVYSVKFVHVGWRCRSVSPLPLRLVLRIMRGVSLSHIRSHTLSLACSLSLSLSLSRARALSLSLSLFPPPLLRAMRGIPASLSPRCQLPAA